MQNEDFKPNFLMHLFVFQVITNTQKIQNQVNFEETLLVKVYKSYFTKNFEKIQHTLFTLKVNKCRKEILGSSILPKNILENFHFCPSRLGQNFFVHFLEELKKPKCSSEIKLPLSFYNFST